MLLCCCVRACSSSFDIPSLRHTHTTHSFLNSLERGSGSILEASSKHLSCAQRQESRQDQVRGVERRLEGRERVRRDTRCTRARRRARSREKRHAINRSAVKTFDRGNFKTSVSLLFHFEREEKQQQQQQQQRYNSVTKNGNNNNNIINNKVKKVNFSPTANQDSKESKFSFVLKKKFIFLKSFNEAKNSI